MVKLKRLNQCAKCPWKVSTNPHDIPDGYSVERHKALESTIAKDAGFGGEKLHVMSCHEHSTEEGVHCIGWLYNQAGRGNNIPLRLFLRNVENARHIKVDGEQHKTFEDTLPSAE